MHMHSCTCASASAQSCDRLAFSSDLLLVLLFVLFLALKVQLLVELYDDLYLAATPLAPRAPRADAARPFATNSLTTSFLMLGSLLVTFSLSSAAFFANILEERRINHVLRWRRDGSQVQARPLLAGRSHVFISHNWKTGQDQSRTIKGA